MKTSFKEFDKENISVLGGPFIRRSVRSETESMSEPLQTDFTPPKRSHRWSARAEANFEAKRIELGVADELKEVPHVTALMLVAFGERGIKSIEDLAGCATDDLYGWIEHSSAKIIRHEGHSQSFQNIP